MGEGPIPALAIGAYADRHGYSEPDEFEAFRRIMRVLDAEYLKVKAERQRQPSP